ncbi:MAG: CpXC domain-containing protein, partial [Anaerolineaceae bacterium]|nr:CpXC domain-containing protein [Anaerolineaceae bacterium]
MTKTSTNCPRCRQPIAADIEQLFDLYLDPGAKQKLLNGAYNFVQCPVCGYAGNLSLPIAYHDPEKELMLTYFPPDLGVPVNEQERMLGPMITKVMGRLPPEKRKAYLLRPETMLTMETMVERILNADGITKEMIQGQKQRVALLQRLIRVSGEERIKIAKQEEAIIDQEFFGILNRIIEATLAQGDQTMARELTAMQKELLSMTEVGREILDQSREVQETIKSLQEASKNGLTREKLLDLILESPSETRVSIVVSMARSGMDYTFFQILSTKIETASEVEKANLGQIREKLLEMTK